MEAFALRVLVTSEKDPASLTIKKVLVEEYGFKQTGNIFDGNPIFALDLSTSLITTTRDLIYSNHIEHSFDAEVFIFCSRHRAKTGQPALLVHSTGNFGDAAEFGGQPNRLSVSTASLVGSALRTLVREHEDRALEEFDVSLEATHHGPTEMDTPLLFIELGSDEKFWTHFEGARAVAAAAMACVKEPFAETAAIGFGGTHYARKFTKIVTTGQLLVGHIAPKYILDSLTPNCVEQMIRRSREKVDTAIIDWKGTNLQQRKKLFPLLEDLGLEIVRV